MSLQEAADRLGVHYMTVYRYVRTGRLEASKPAGQWVVEQAALEAFLQAPGPAEARTARTPASKARAARLEARMLAGDRPGALEVVDASLASGATWSEVQVDLLAPALRSIGDRWESGELTVGDEHRATVVAQHLLGLVGARFTRRGRRRDTVVIGAVPGEAHQIPVTIAADHLRAAGLDVVDFGADTPADAFADAAEELSPLAVVIGATTSGRHAAIRRVISAVRAAAPSVPVLIGGAAVDGPEAARRLGADGWTGPDAPAVVEAVLALRPAPTPKRSATDGGPT